MIGKNHVLEHKPTGSRWRVLDMDMSSNNVWLFNLDDTKAVPKKTSAHRVQDPDEFIEIERPRCVAKLNHSKAAKQRRDKAYALITPLITTMDIYDPAIRSAMVLARAEELKCSPQTIYKHLRAWWRNGQNLQALTPQFHRSGNVAGTTGGRGRPSKYGTPTYQTTPADLALIQDIVKSNYLTRVLVTLEDTYQTLLEKHYSYVDAECRLILKLPGERPSLAQFRRHARKQLPTELVIRSRKGDTEFELNHRAVLGSLRHATFTVGDVYEIDSTVVDFFLVHHDNRAKIIGKPCLYMIRDRKSNLIIGFYVGLEEASWLAALQAILSIAEDKRTLCNRYGVSYSPEDWPAHGVMPKEFLGDRGPEMLGNESTKIADGLDLIITNLPKGRGDWKPHVECGFKQTQRALRGVIPGYVPPEDFGKRQRRDYSQDAQHTLSEFRKIILEIIIKHNKSPMPSYPLAPQYVLQGMQPTPTNIWNTEIQDRAGLLSTYTEEEVRLALLPKTEVAVTREGIQLGECFYGAQEAIDYGWFVAAGHSRFTVQASYDLRLVDTIYIHDEGNPNLYFKAHLLDKCSHFRGLSHREVEALGFLKRQLNHQGEQLTRQLKAEFHQNVAATVSQGRSEMKKATAGKSRSARKKDTKVARQDALRRERTESVRSSASTIEPSAKVIPMPTGRPDSTSVDAAPPSPSNSRQQKYMDLLHGR